jgi:chemotaxis protein MotB
MSSRKPVIIKRVKKITAAGHHGGSWKVAYADFVTAMMAFFLLLWLLSMVSEEKRARISEYYKNFSLYSESGSSFLSGADDALFSTSGQGNEKVLTELEGDDSEAEDIQESLSKAIADKLGDLEEQVLIEKVRDGIRIHLTDNEGSTMFQSGSNKMTAKAKEILGIIAGNIKSLKNKVSIEGHTDALPFAGDHYSNWELSTERASSARRELEANGLDPKRLVSVAGFADTDPLIKDDPNDARNRRISIILKFPQKKKKVQNPLIGDKSPAKKVSEELLKILDKSSRTARGHNDTDSVNAVIKLPESEKKRPETTPSSSVGESQADGGPYSIFTPVIDKNDLHPDISLNHNDVHKDGTGTKEKDFSPVINKEGWNPVF